MKRVAIVILNWNGKLLMEQFLPSILKYSPAEIAEIIVADNGSTDDSITMLRDKFPTVQLILLDRNYGFAEGYNQAIERIDLPYVVLLNSDVEVSSGWLDAPLAALDADPSIAAVQPKLLAEQNRQFFEYAGAAGGYMDYLGYPYCRGRIFQCIEEDKGQYDTPTDILWGSGACLFIRTDVYKKEGGLDSHFFAHQEEIDFCWRLRTRGYRLVCIPQSVVYHVGGGTLNAESPRKTFLNFRNNLLMLYKNLPEKRLLAVMRRRFFLDYLAALQFLLSGKKANAMAVYKARKEFHKLKSRYIPIRKENLKKRTVQDIPEINGKSLLFTFYLKGKRRYSDL